jgi:hypothetical protein
MVKVTSDSVKSFERGDGDTIIVTFNDDSKYVYKKVPMALYTLLVQAAVVPNFSFGTLFHYLIKVPGPKVYPYTKL